MEKDLKKMLNNLKGMLETMTFANGKFKDLMEDSLSQPCKITIEKNKKGGCKMGVEGQRLALLITLAGAEQGILKQLNCSSEEFDFIKRLVATKEDEDNE